MLFQGQRRRTVLRLLQSIFGSYKGGSYPESLVREAVERAVDGTDPWLRAVSGYRKKLRPSVIRAMDHVVALVDGLPPAVSVDPASYADDLRLKSLFISSDEMNRFIAGDRSLAEFMKGSGGGASRITALLAMEKQEQVTLTEDHSGDVVIRDVRQVIVTFDGHRFIDPSTDEGETRRLLMRRAYDHLLAMALTRLTAVKTERGELEQRRLLLESKLNLLERGGWGFDQAGASQKITVAEVEGRIGEIEAQLKGLGGDDRILGNYLEIVADLLGRPEEHFWARNETIFVGRMGVRRSEASKDASELTYSELHNAEGRSLVVMPVSLQREELQRFFP
jgi:hypothetical protein